MYGLARSSKKATELSRDEIIPIMGEAEKIDQWVAAAEKIHVDVIVDCSGVMQGAKDILQGCVTISKKRIEAFGTSGYKVAKLGYIYISGMLVHGDSQEYGNDLNPVGEHAPVKPGQLIAWRTSFESEALRQSKILNVVVLRPGLLFGGSMSFIASWWGPILAEVAKGEMNVELAGKEDAVIALVHRDDIGQAVTKTVERVCIRSAQSGFAWRLTLL